VYYVNSSSDVIKRNAANTLTPTSLTFTGWSVTGNNTPVTYAGRFRVSRNGTIVYTSAGNESSYVYTPTGPDTLATVLVEFFQAGGTTVLLDSESIQVVTDGANAFTITTDNDNMSFSGPATGFGSINFGAATSTIRVYLGSTLLGYNAAGNSTWNVTSLTQSGVSGTAGVGSGTSYILQPPTGMSTNPAYTDVNITIRDAANNPIFSSVRVTYTLARLGADATSYWVNSSTDVFKRNDANVLTPASVTFTGFSAFGASAPALYAGRFIVARNGVNVYTSSINETAYTYTPTTPGTLTDVRVRMYLAGGVTNLVDEESIQVVVDGSPAFTVSVDNDSKVFVAPTTGFAGINFGTSASLIRVYKGSTQLSYNTSGANTFSITFANTNATVPAGTIIAGNSFSIPVPTAMTQDTGFTDATVTIRDGAAVSSTQTVRINYALARQGITGTPGSQGVQGTGGGTGVQGVGGGRGAGRWNIPVASLPTNNATAQAAWDAGWTGRPGVQITGDQAWFYTGTQVTPTGQSVFIYSGGVWNLQTQAIDGNLLVTGTITAAKIAAGAITVDKLAVGSTENNIRNSDYSAGNIGWTVSASDGNNPNGIQLNEAGNSFAGPAERTLFLHQANSASTGFSDVRYHPKANKTGTNFGMRVIPGEKVALQCRVGSHRCIAELRIEWRNAAGGALSYSVPSIVNNNPGSSLDPMSLTLLSVLDTAPAGAFWATLHLRKVATIAGFGDSFIFWYRPMISIVPVNATQVPAFSHGSYTTIEGGAINATTISSISADLGMITAGTIRGGTVVAAGGFTAGITYLIESIGTTNFTAIGASSNTIGLAFTATSAGSGTGTALTAQRIIINNQNITVYDTANVLRVRMGIW
jgi:hypothetical protein